MCLTCLTQILSSIKWNKQTQVSLSILKHFRVFLMFQLTQLLIWQISSVTITTLPIYSFLMLYLASSLGGLEFEKIYMTVLFFGPLFGGILYILARAVTLVLAFTSLRGLSAGAYETVHWTTFIPHV